MPDFKNSKTVRDLKKLEKQREKELKRMTTAKSVEDLYKGGWGSADPNFGKSKKKK